MPKTKITPASGRLAKLIAEYEHKLDALKTTALLLNGHATNGKVPRAERILAEALDADAHRRSGWGGKRKRRQLRTRTTKTDNSTRKATAKFLAKVAAHDGPYTGSDRAKYSALILHGYLKKSGPGVIRTDKVYTP